VRAYVAKRRPEIRAEHGRSEPGAFIPQTHLPDGKRRSTSEKWQSGCAVRWPPCTCSHYGCPTLRPRPRVSSAGTGAGPRAALQRGCFAQQPPKGSPHADRSQTANVAARCPRRMGDRVFKGLARDGERVVVAQRMVTRGD
jgi:hypothetical protein